MSPSLTFKLGDKIHNGSTKKEIENEYGLPTEKHETSAGWFYTYKIDDTYLELFIENNFGLVVVEYRTPN